MIEQLPSDWPQLLRSALTHHQAGRLAEAESLYRQVLQHQPRQPDGLRLLGVLFRQRGELQQASHFLKLALEAQPNSADAHYDMGIALFDRKEYPDAVRFYRRALELRPQFPEALHNLGNAYAAQWCLDEAARCYERALEQAPGLPEPQQSLAWIRQKDSELSAITESLQRAGSAKRSEGSGSAPRGNHPKLLTRELLPYLLNKAGLTGLGVEVGVQSGQFSEHLLRNWKGRRLYSIDPWREFPRSDYVDVANVPQSRHDELYRATIQRLMPYEGRSIIWRLTSNEAAALLPNGSLDFCYLDGDHSYQAVAEDIRMWFEKVRDGGLLSGHDYIPDGTYPVGNFGVQRAVNEFVAARGLEVFTSSEPNFPSWFAVKTASG